MSAPHHPYYSAVGWWPLSLREVANFFAFFVLKKDLLSSCVTVFE